MSSPYTPQLLRDAWAAAQADPLGQLGYIETHGTPKDQLLALCELVQGWAERTNSNENVTLSMGKFTALWQGTLLLARVAQELPDHEYTAIVDKLLPAAVATVEMVDFTG